MYINFVKNVVLYFIYTCLAQATSDGTWVGQD